MQAEGFDDTQDPDSAPASPSTSGSDGAPVAEMPLDGPLGAGGEGGPSRAEATGDFQSLGAERARKKSALRECAPLSRHLNAPRDKNFLQIPSGRSQQFHLCAPHSEGARHMYLNERCPAVMPRRRWFDCCVLFGIVLCNYSDRFFAHKLLAGAGTWRHLIRQTMVEMTRVVSAEGAALVEAQTSALFGDLKQLQRQMQVQATTSAVVSSQDHIPFPKPSRGLVLIGQPRLCGAFHVQIAPWQLVCKMAGLCHRLFEFEVHWACCLRMRLHGLWTVFRCSTGAHTAVCAPRRSIA